MSSENRTVSSFHQVLQSLAGLSERQQVTTLKFELFDALARAEDCHAHCAELEERVTAFRTQTADRAREHQEFAARLYALLRERSQELSEVKAAHEKQLRTVRLELVAAEAQAEELESMCVALLATIEQAACEAGDAGASAAEAAGVSS